ncbi:MAG: hypothetical protein EA422_11715 [Gemmatimonadales bacterium]|nr:MAG: hypothetical protein EA422_11715 [Gemmatimonadales bacterium]
MIPPRGTPPLRCGRAVFLLFLALPILLWGCGGDGADPSGDAGVEASASDTSRGSSGVVLQPRGERTEDPTIPSEPQDPASPPMEIDTLPLPDTLPTPGADHPTPIPEQDTGSPAAQVDTVTGVVDVTGTGAAPTAVVRPEEGGELGLTGERARELRSLAGGTVQVWGRRAATPVGPGLEVLDYRLLEMEGRSPRVGVLEQGGPGEWALRDRDSDETHPLLGMPSTGIGEGLLVWVVGTEDAQGRIIVEFHGVIQVDPA